MQIGIYFNTEAAKIKKRTHIPWNVPSDKLPTNKQINLFCMLLAGPRRARVAAWSIELSFFKRLINYHIGITAWRTNGRIHEFLCSVLVYFFLQLLLLLFCRTTRKITWNLTVSPSCPTWNRPQGCRFGWCSGRFQTGRPAGFSPWLCKPSDWPPLQKWDRLCRINLQIMLKCICWFCTGSWLLREVPSKYFCQIFSPNFTIFSRHCQLTPYSSSTLLLTPPFSTKTADISSQTYPWQKPSATIPSPMPQGISLR